MRRGRDRARDDLLVEGPQVLEAAAAAREQDHVEAAQAVERADALRDLGRGALALDERGVDEHLEVGVARAQHAQDVAQHGAGGRGHDADPARQHRQRALARGVEEALLLELLLQLLEGLLQRALAERLEQLHRQLVLAARRVDAELSAREHLHSVARPEAHQPGVGLPDHRAQLRLLVLQREVPVAGRRELEVRDLAFDPDVQELGLEHALDPLGELGDGERAPAARLRLRRGRLARGGGVRRRAGAGFAPRGAGSSPKSRPFWLMARRSF